MANEDLLLRQMPHSLEGEHHFELFVILVVVGAAGVADAVGADLVEQVTQRRIGIDVDLEIGRAHV